MTKITCYLLSFPDLQFVQYMNAVYTDTLASDKAPDGIFPVTGSDVLENVRQLKNVAKLDEAQHRRNAVEGMLNLQKTTPKRKYCSSKILYICTCFYPPPPPATMLSCHFRIRFLQRKVQTTRRQKITINWQQEKTWGAACWRDRCWGWDGTHWTQVVRRRVHCPLVSRRGLPGRVVPRPQ